MKGAITLLAAFCMFIFYACNREGQLTGKWQTASDPTILVEFTDSGKYYLVAKGEILITLPYSYSVHAKKNNLCIGEDPTMVLGQVEFLSANIIRITATKPETAIEYYRVGHAPAAESNHTTPESVGRCQTESDSVYIAASPINKSL